MTNPIFSIIKYKQWEYDNMVKEIVRDMPDEVPTEMRKGIAESFVKQYISVEAYTHLKQLNLKKFNKGYE